MMRSREKDTTPHKSFLFCFSLQAGVIMYTSLVFVVMICAALHNVTAEVLFTPWPTGYCFMFLYLSANCVSLIIASTGAFMLNYRIVFFGSCLLAGFACLWFILSILGLLYFVPAYRYLCIDERCPTTHWLFDEGIRSFMGNCISSPSRHSEQQRDLKIVEGRDDSPRLLTFPTTDDSVSTESSKKGGQRFATPSTLQSRTTDSSIHLRVTTSLPTSTSEVLFGSTDASKTDVLPISADLSIKTEKVASKTRVATKPAYSTKTKKGSLKLKSGIRRLFTGHSLDNASLPTSSSSQYQILKTLRPMSQSKEAEEMRNVTTTVNLTASARVTNARFKELYYITTGMANQKNVSSDTTNTFESSKDGNRENQTTASESNWYGTFRELVGSSSVNIGDEFNTIDSLITENEFLNSSADYIFEGGIPRQSTLNVNFTTSKTTCEVPGHRKFKWRTPLNDSVPFNHTKLSSSRANEYNNSNLPTEHPLINKRTYKYIRLILDILKNWGVIYKITRSSDETPSVIANELKTENRTPTGKLVSFEQSHVPPRKHCSYVYVNFLWTLVLFVIYIGFTIYGLWTCFVFAKYLKSKSEESLAEPSSEAMP